MLKVVNLLVRSIDTSNRELSWEIEPTTEDPLDFTFQIYRSESEAGPFEPITDLFSDKYYFIDNVLPADKLWRTFFYFIEVKKKGTSKEDWSEIAHVGTPRNRYAKEISRVERSAFAEAAGTRVYVLPMKTFGQWCSCFDRVSQQRSTDHCLECYNTNFVGGYHDAVETYAQIRQFTKTETTDQPAVTEKAAVNIVLTNYPIVKPGDILFEPDSNRRWKLAFIDTTRLGGSLVHQNVSASLIDRDEVAYSVKIEDFDVFRPNYPDMLMHPRTSL